MFRKPLTLRNSNQVNKIDLNYSIKPTNRENSIPKPKDSHKKQNVSNSTLTENAGAHSEDKTNVLSRNEKVKVFLRMRKLLTGENSICFNISNNNIVVHPNSQSPTSKFCMDKSFTFRQIFDEKASQLNVFENVALPLLPDFLDGNDVLIFCYGSTNAGKTYTVSGSQEFPGLLQRSLDYIVSKIHENHGTHSQQLFVSFFEIYNEKFYDLLDIKHNMKSFKLGLNDNGEMEVKGVKEIRIISHEDTRNVIALAESGRHKGVTELNCDSSRSHTIFQVRLKKKNATQAVFSMVDLAGSERVSVMKSQKGSFKEACNINKSMLVLGKCIRKLNEQSLSANPSSVQIPYRESKLTHLFKNFFEPVCRPSKASIIINVSPCQIQYDDTLFSLQFAHEASMCSIRQVERQAMLCDNTETYDEIDMEIRKLEKKIEARIRSEMDEFLRKQEVEYIKRMNEIYARCSGNTLNDGINIEDSNICCDNLSTLKEKIVTISNDNLNLRSLIQANYDKIQQVTKENKQIMAQNRDLELELQNITERNKLIQQKIEAYLGEKESPMVDGIMINDKPNDFSILANPKSSILSKDKRDCFGIQSDHCKPKDSKKVVILSSHNVKT